MQLNGNFSWRNFFLGFITRKFVLAVVLQVIATYFAYDALATLNAAALLSGKAAAQYAPQIVELFWKWALFTMANGATFGLFNSASKLAGVAHEQVTVGGSMKDVVPKLVDLGKDALKSKKSDSEDHPDDGQSIGPT